MKHTKHALSRCRQRGIPESAIGLIATYGTMHYRPGDTIEYRMSRKDRDAACKEVRKLLHILEKTEGAAILVGTDGTVISVYR